MKIRLTTLELCVSSFLCGIRTDLWPFYGFYCNRFDLSTIPIQSPYRSLYFHSTMSMLIFEFGLPVLEQAPKNFNPNSWRFRRERGGEIS